MHKFRLALLMLAALLCASAKAEITRDVVYGHKDGMALVMDIYRPEANNNGAGVAFMVSGGFTSSLEMQTMMEVAFVPLVEAGFTVFAVRHGSFPQYKMADAYADVSKGLQFIGANAGSYGVDPQRVGIFGGSAGGLLALLAGLADTGANGEDPTFRVKAVVAYYPPTHELLSLGIQPFYPEDLSLLPGLTPINHISANDPPVLLVHGDSDDLVPIEQSEAMYAALQNSGVTTDFVAMAGSGHGFRGEAADEANKLLIDWFSKYLLY